MAFYGMITVTLTFNSLSLSFHQVVAPTQHACRPCFAVDRCCA